MIFQKPNVRLTKVFYYDRNRAACHSQIATISAKLENVVIKRNVFGNRWILKINESPEKKSNARVFVYVLVLVSIAIAVAGGIFLTFEHRFRKVDHFENRTRHSEDMKMEKNPTMHPCDSCDSEQICLKKSEIERPNCVRIIDKNDPTGCGGLCKVNTQYCKLLDRRRKIFQCINNRRSLNCSADFFNCGNRCITKNKRCDGIMDCSDHSDENNCVCDLKANFHCGNFTSCVDLTKKCDRKIDCWDHSDEADCPHGCHEDEFPCTNGDCVRKILFCDGKEHCRDGSDEPKGCK